MARYPGFGAFGELGGFIDIKQEIVPDPDEYAIEMLEIADYLDDIEMPLFAARRIAMEDMQAHFDKEESPEGIKWAKLDPDYLRQKQSQGYPDNILQRTQDLMHAATSQEAWLVEEEMLVFDTSALPEYGTLHQTGAGDEANVGLAATHRFNIRTEAFAGIEGESTNVKENLGIGSGNALPARPFIGLSDEAAAVIYQIFDQWFDEATHLTIHGRTGVAQQRIGSRFGPRIGL